jgi:hypothetical protein
VLLAGGGVPEVVDGLSYDPGGEGCPNLGLAPLQELEEPFCVLFLVVGGLGEYR